MFADAVRHHQAGRLLQAQHRYRQILALWPDFSEALNNLGNILVSCSRLDDAVASYRKAMEIRPNYADAHMNLGGALLEQGKLEESAISYRKALDYRANNVEVLVNLGNILGELGMPEEAVNCYRRALLFKPDFPLAHANLGATLCGLGRLDEAIASYLCALEIKPDFAMVLNNLASALIVQGKPAAALNAARRSLQIEEAEDTKGILVSALSHLHGLTDTELRPLIVRALSEAWGWPHALARACIDLAKLDCDIAGCVARAIQAWPRPLPGKVLFGPNGLGAVGASPLLSALLDAGPICDVEMERFLTMARHTLLDAATDLGGSGEGVEFYTVLARQCFINEYVFFATTEEARKANELRDLLSAALSADEPVPVIWLLAVAAYFPLYSLPVSTRLLERSWPEEIQSLLSQQVREPAEEHRIRATVSQLTDIEDKVSLLVQRQYEENPYPRWVKLPPPGSKVGSIEAYLRQTFPLAAFDRLRASTQMEFLVAGCGTGQQSIRTSQQFPTARILAVDLSKSSLAYAIRKTRELNIRSIEYGQADLLKMGSLGRRFDVITAGGVLHHLAEPWTGWRTLLALLRPGGFMFLGLYSKIARQDIARLRAAITEQGYGTAADEIRRCRQALMDATNGFGSADGRPSDLFTISACRDLLFHVQEHCVSLTEIDRFLRENNLAFLGFDIAANILQSYRSRFPRDLAATDLAQWQVFEYENPQVFVGMYQFWVQKR